MLEKLEIQKTLLKAEHLEHFGNAENLTDLEILKNPKYEHFGNLEIQKTPKAYNLDTF